MDTISTKEKADILTPFPAFRGSGIYADKPQKTFSHRLLSALLLPLWCSAIRLVCVSSPIARAQRSGRRLRGKGAVEEPRFLHPDRF